MTHTRSVVVGVFVAIGMATAIVPVRAVVPLDFGSLPVFLPVTINDGSGDQFDAHVDGDIASYTSDNTIRYYDFVNGIDAQVPTAPNTADQLSGVSNGQIAFSRLDFDTGFVSIRLFDIATATTSEIDPQPAMVHSNSAVDGGTVAFIDSTLGPGDLRITRLGDSTAQVTSDTRFDQRPAVAPSGNVVVYESCLTSANNCDIRQATWNGTSWAVTILTNNAEPEAYPDTDGTFVVYDATRGGERDVYWQPVGGGPEQRLELAGEQRDPSISGGLVAFNSVAPSASSDLFVYQIATNRLFRITLTPANETLSDIDALPGGQYRLVWNSGPSGARDVYGVTIELPPTPGGTYSFGGFRQPVAPVPAVNLMKAGGAVPIKFSLGGFHGMEIFASGHPKSSPISCSSTALTVGIDETVSPGGSSLQYDADADVYTYVWKTDKSWAGTCRQLILQFADATVEYANFQFK
jgi:hypothetical protein